MPGKHNFAYRALAVAGLAGLASGLAFPAAGQVQYTSIALSGQPAMGLPGLVFARVADPRLSDDFSTAFWANLGPGVADTDDGSLWVDHGQGSFLAARENDSLPGAGIFGLATAQLSGAGLLSYSFAQKVTPSGPAQVAFAAQSSQDVSVAIVDTEPAQPPSLGRSFSFPIPRTDDGRSAYTLAPAGSATAVLRVPTGDINVGDPAPVAGTTLPVGSVYRRFTPPVMNANGDLVFRAWAGNQTDAATWRQGLWVIRSGQSVPVAVVAEGDPSPDAGLVFRDMTQTPQIALDGKVVFESRLVQGTSTAFTGLYRWNNGVITRLVVTGQTIGQTGLTAGSTGARFAMSPSGQIAALVRLSGAPAGTNAAIIHVSTDDQIDVVVREGDAAPGLAGATVGPLFEPRMNGAGGVAFSAAVTGDPARQVTLFAQARPGATIWPLVSVGEDFTPPGGVAAKVRSLSFDHDSAASGLSQFVGRSLAFKIVFADESSALVRADLPAPGSIADINLDGQVTIEDFFAFFSAWDRSAPPADVDGQQGVTLEDFFAFFNAWDA